MEHLSPYEPMQPELSEVALEPHAAEVHRWQTIPHEEVHFSDEVVNPPRVLLFRHAVPLPAELPHGYGYQGGVARNVALQELLGEPVMEPRDVDYVAILDFDPDFALNKEIVDQHASPASYWEGGTTSLASYFLDRDFVLNEVLVHGHELYATEAALNDLEQKIIRPSAYEEGGWEDYNSGAVGTKPKLVMKALRLAIEFLEMYGQGKVEGIEDWQWRFDRIPLFDLALSLNKAYERGDALAYRFYARFIEMGLAAQGEIPFDAESPRELALEIQYHMLEQGRDPFDFCLPELNPPYASEAEVDPELARYEYYADLANTHLRQRRSEDAF